MANPEHVEILKSGSEAIQSWRESHPQERLELRDADLQGVNLIGAQLPGANLSQANLHAAVLTEANLGQAVVAGANLTEANLSRADLNRTNLRSANLNGAFCRGAEMLYADLRQATMVLADLTRARLNGADLGAANLSGALFVEADLCGALLEEANLRRVEFVGANLRRARLNGANLCEADFSRACLGGADLSGAQCGATVWRTLELAEAVGLDQLSHLRPSWIDVETILRARCQWSTRFLRGCGLPEAFIARAGELAASAGWNSCFVCFAEPDAAFSHKLIDALQERGIRCWPAVLSKSAGHSDQVSSDLLLADAILLCLSSHLLHERSLQDLVRSALAREERLANFQDARPQVLKVLDLDGAAKAGKGKSSVLELLRGRIVADFVGSGTDDDRFRQGTEQLARALAVDTRSADSSTPSGPPATTKSSSPQPDAAPKRDFSAEVEKLRALPGKVDGLVSGFRRLLKNDGGNSIWFDFRGKKAPTHHLRQLSAGNAIEWETAPVSDEIPGPMVYFVFAGSFGGINEPASAGFLFAVNGLDEVAFDLAPSDAMWQNAPKTVALLFQRRWSSEDDAAGFFYIGVSLDSLTLGQPCRISVTAQGTDSERWFGINPVPDPVALQARQVSD